MCFFKKKKKDKATEQQNKKDNMTFQDWHKNTNNFGFNERASKLEGEFQNASSNTDTQAETQSNTNNPKNTNAN